MATELALDAHDAALSATLYDRSSTYSDLKKTAFIQRHIRAQSGKSVLELGAGRGANMVGLAGYDLLGVEIDPEQQGAAQAAGLPVVLGNARTFSAGRSFDVVVASEVIEHVVQPEHIFENAARHLKPGGLFVATIPNGWGPYEFLHTHLHVPRRLRRWNLLRRLRGKPLYVRGDSQDHCQWFTMGRFLKLARKSGFELIEQANSDLIGGSEKACQIADKLPAWAVSGWYFAFRKVA